MLWKTSLWLPGVGVGAGMTGKGSRGGLGAFVKTGRKECHAVDFTVCKLNFFMQKKQVQKRNENTVNISKNRWNGLIIREIELSG